MTNDDPDTDGESTENVWDEVEEFAHEDATADDALGDVFDTPPSDDADYVDAEITRTDRAAGGDRFDDAHEERANAVDHPSAVDNEVVDDEVIDVGTVEDGPEPDADEAFEEMDVSAVDGEALWDELAASESDAAAFDSSDAEGSGIGESSATGRGVGESSATGQGIGETEPRDTAGDEESLIDKRVYCQQCPYFTAPPEVRCTHDGTAIIEVIEDGRFRVSDCPVVTETGPDRTILNDGD